jgi:hypothetical protein
MKKIDKTTSSRTRSSAGSPTLPKAGRQTKRQDQLATSHRPALHILLSKTVEFLLSAGESPESIASELEGLAQRVNARGRISRARDAKHVREDRVLRAEVCGVVHDWYREPASTNQEGDPLQLPYKSLRRIVGKRFPKPQVSEAVRWMFKLGIIRKTSRGKVALVGGRQVLYPRKAGQRAMALDRAAALVPQYLRISLRNADTRDVYSRDIDRDARILYLPEKYVPLWRNVVRERAQAFLEGVDNWLEDHARRDDVGSVREVAVHCYAYTGDPRSHSAASTNIRRVKVDS